MGQRTSADRQETSGLRSGVVAVLFAASLASCGIDRPGSPTDVSVAPVTVTTSVLSIAGSGAAAFTDGIGNAAQFHEPEGIAVDPLGNVYVADTKNNRIRLITPAGVVTTFAGSGAQGAHDGVGALATFFHLQGLAFGADGNLYVADANAIRKITLDGVVTTIAGGGSGALVNGSGAGASFAGPWGVAADVSGNVYVGDFANHCLRKVTAEGTVTTLAGSNEAGFVDGPSLAARFDYPEGLALGSSGDLYVGDSLNGRIRRVTLAGVVSTFAGSGAAEFADGPGTAATFHSPKGIAVDAKGNVYVADELNFRIRKVTADGVVTTLAGVGTPGAADGPGDVASFKQPAGVAVDNAGNVYVTDTGNNLIRVVSENGPGQLFVTWQPSPGTDITAYTASAEAAGQSTQSCTTTGMAGCTIHGLASGVTYNVSVTGANAAGTSDPSLAAIGTPN